MLGACPCYLGLMLAPVNAFMLMRPVSAFMLFSKCWLQDQGQVHKSKDMHPEPAQEQEYANKSKNMLTRARICSQAQEYAHKSKNMLSKTSTGFNEQEQTTKNKPGGESCRCRHSWGTWSQQSSARSTPPPTCPPSSTHCNTKQALTRSPFHKRFRGFF